MSVGRTRQRAGSFAALVLLTGCGARVSLGDYLGDVPGADGGITWDDAEPPFFDAEPVEVDGAPDGSDASAESLEDAPADPDASAD